MLIKKITALFLGVFLCANLTAQNEADVLRYSFIQLGGTARSMSMAGAFSVLGADFSTLSSNPAGVALYRRSEFTWSPSVYRGETSSSYLGNKSGDDKYNFNISNGGIVYAFRMNDQNDNQGWTSWSFGFGYNRLSNFHSRSHFEGVNSKNSLLDHYLEKVNTGNGTNSSSLPDLDPYGASLAFNTYLIDTIPGDTNHYLSAIPFYGELQRRTSTTRGSMGEVVFSFGGNYNDRLFIGGTVGIATVTYKEETVYEETDQADTIFDFKSFKLNQDLHTTGTGFNFKFGMIFRPSDWMRIGGAIHAPTFLTLSDDYSYRLKSYFDNGQNYVAESPKGSFDYQVTTPFRAIGSIAFIFGKMGLLSADYEFVDYTAARLRSSDYAFVDENNSVQDIYRATGNLKLGAEWKIGPYSLRGGYALYGSPFRGGLNPSSSNMSRTSYTAGFGIRDNDYFVDFAYVFSKYGEFYRSYSLSTQDVEGVENQVYTYNFVLTLGLKF